MMPLGMFFRRFLVAENLPTRNTNVWLLDYSFVRKTFNHLSAYIVDFRRAGSLSPRLGRIVSSASSISPQVL